MDIQIDKIIRDTYVDGPGRRVALFMQGCTIGCPGCQNTHLWPAGGGRGHRLTVAQAASEMLWHAAERHHNFTVSGGEPFQQPEALAALVNGLKAGDAAAHIIVYTGYHYDVLREHPNPAVAEVLAHVDVLVDGPYLYQRDGATMQYRGSDNQRPIDLKASRQAGELVLLDWDQPEVIITHDGRTLGTGPVTAMLEEFGLGDAVVSRRCGQTRETG